MSALLLLAGVLAYVAVGLLAARVVDRWAGGDSPWDPAALAGVVLMWPLALAAGLLIAGCHLVVWLADKSGRALARLAGLEVRS